jgi:hypothetical protein
VLRNQGIVGGLAIVAKRSSQILSEGTRSICCNMRPRVAWVANETLAQLDGRIEIAMAQTAGGVAPAFSVADKAAL